MTCWGFTRKLSKYSPDLVRNPERALAAPILIRRGVGWRTLFHSSWRTFRTKFSGDLARLKRHRDLLSDEKITATILDVGDFRESVEEKLNELSRKLQDLHLEDEEREHLRRRQQLDHKRQFVLSKLDPPNYQYDYGEAMKQRHGSSSGDWILQDSTFQAWGDPVENGHKKLYLSGIPGAGLCHYQIIASPA